VESGIECLPEWVRAELVNVAFIIEDEPTPETRKEHSLQDDETLFGLYEGVPLTERGNDTPLLPDTITIFMKSILEAHSSEEDIRECVSNTIWHEVAHYFGHDEAWVSEEEIRRGKLK
jgi:predicted Zn-dependent protease with MMP-like domain